MKSDFYFEKTTQGNKDTDDEETIEIPRSMEFAESAQKLSEFINKLPLSKEQNDKLIDLMVKHVLTAEDGGFRYGLKIGIECGKSGNEWRGNSRPSPIFLR